jgi:hypothetical protein
VGNSKLKVDLVEGGPIPIQEEDSLFSDGLAKLAVPGQTRRHGEEPPGKKLPELDGR